VDILATAGLRTARLLEVRLAEAETGFAEATFRCDGESMSEDFFAGAMTACRVDAGVASDIFAEDLRLAVFRALGGARDLADERVVPACRTALLFTLDAEGRGAFAVVALCAAVEVRCGFALACVAA
jgi:hypothetical protein